MSKSSTDFAIEIAEGVTAYQKGAIFFAGYIEHMDKAKETMKEWKFTDDEAEIITFPDERIQVVLKKDVIR